MCNPFSACPLVAVFHPVECRGRRTQRTVGARGRRGGDAVVSRTLETLDQLQDHESSWSYAPGLHTTKYYLSLGLFRDFLGWESVTGMG